MAKSINASALLLLGSLIATFFFSSSHVENEIQIEGPPERVFDLVTTAKYWTEWHPATFAVSGATEQPMQLGQTIREVVNIFGVPGGVEWQVVQRERPYTLQLRGSSGPIARATIRYTFQPQGESVKFTRTLEYAFLGLGGPLDWFWIKPIMESQSAVALKNLKLLVERQLGQ